MAKKRKSTTTSLATTAMDLDHPTPLQPKNPILSANTNAGISKPTKKSLHLPRGKGRRAQRLRKEKASERAEEIQGRTERKVERSKGRGKRRGERNAAWEEMNAKIKGALMTEMGKGETKVVGGRKDEDEDEEEWVDEEEPEKMVDEEDDIKTMREAATTAPDGVT
ncbi:MAG: hypothetical protein Q9208_000509 [Pyrenodesmia sp. 3 TL-2023]